MVAIRRGSVTGSMHLGLPVYGDRWALGAGLREQIPPTACGRAYSLADDHSDEEDRIQTIGLAEDILFVVYTERGDDTLLITARLAEPKERRIYYGDSTKYLQGWRRVNS
ncbi:hypothetical protein FACS1894137_17850 [Spirochaetia bacterium]|nr:hypothetical protein FACS1894137_17850 [Spirochaetia bacterium]